MYLSLMTYPSEDLCFNPSLRLDLNWYNSALRLGTILPANKSKISQGLKDLSYESIRNRFMGSKKEFSETELEYLTNFDGWNHYALGLEERERPFRGVAVARLVRSSIDSKEAEIAITIIDDYQKLGLGTLLIKLLALAAAERNLDRLSFTFLPQNEGIIKLIHRLGPSYSTGHSKKDEIHLLMNLNQLNFLKIKKDVEDMVPGLSIILKNLKC
jgi:RimJ/RimL family protein N-acetyltransferase